MSGAQSNFCDQIKKNPSYAVGSAVLVMVAGRLNFSDGHVGGPEVFLLLSALLYARYIVHSASQEPRENGPSTPASEVALRLAAGLSFVAGNVRACLLHYVARSPVWVDLAGPLVAYASMLCCAKMIANMIWDKPDMPDDPDNAPLFDNSTKRHLFFLSASTVLTGWLYKNVYGAGSLIEALAHAMSLNGDGFLNPALSSVGIAAEFVFYALLFGVFLVAYNEYGTESNMAPFRDILEESKKKEEGKNAQEGKSSVSDEVIGKAKEHQLEVVNVSVVESYLYQSLRPAITSEQSDTKEAKDEAGSFEGAGRNGSASSPENNVESPSLDRKACLEKINALFEQECKNLEAIFNDIAPQEGASSCVSSACKEVITALKRSRLIKCNDSEPRSNKGTSEQTASFDNNLSQVKAKIEKIDSFLVQALICTYNDYVRANLARYHVQDRSGWHLETKEQVAVRELAPLVEKVARALISARAYLQIAMDLSGDNEKESLEGLAAQLIPNDVWKQAQRGKLPSPAPPSEVAQGTSSPLSSCIKNSVKRRRCDSVWQEAQRGNLPPTYAAGACLTPPMRTRAKRCLSAPLPDKKGGPPVRRGSAP